MKIFLSSLRNVFSYEYYTHNTVCGMNAFHRKMKGRCPIFFSNFRIFYLLYHTPYQSHFPQSFFHALIPFYIKSVVFFVTAFLFCRYLTNRCIVRVATSTKACLWKVQLVPASKPADFKEEKKKEMERTTKESTGVLNR